MRNLAVVMAACVVCSSCAGVTALRSAGEQPETASCSVDACDAGGHGSIAPTLVFTALAVSASAIAATLLAHRSSHRAPPARDW